MQAFKTLFSRAQVQAVSSVPQAPAAQPIELSAESLKLVAGGLPRIGGLGTSSATTGTDTAAATLPSVG